MARQDFDGLEIRKRSKEVQRRGLGQAPDHLGLAQEPLEASVDLKHLVFWRRQRCSASEALCQSLARHQVWSPPRSAPGM